MTMQTHVDSLRTKHAQLDERIDDELHRPLPDQSTVTRLKREKLKLKEEIARSSPVDLSTHEVAGSA